MNNAPVRHKAAGFTLVEMALSLTLVGLAVAALLVAFRIYMGDHAVNMTKKNVQTVAQSIENFVLENGRFPCPAAVDLTVDNPRYGQEADCANLRGYTAAGAVAGPVSAGNFGGGIWVERGAVNPGSQMVVRGMVPFHALNLPEQYANDGYTNRIFYAVTARQTQTENFMREGGEISVVDSSASGSGNTQKNHFIVFSAGANKQGAYNRYGREVLPCGSGLDRENCNTSTAGMGQNAIYMSARYSTATGADGFDDYIVNSTTMQMPLWRLDDASAFNIRAIDLGNRVMVGNVTPAASPVEVRVDIGGNVRNTLNTYGGKYCLNGDGNRCFESELIAGNRAEMECRNAVYARAQPGNFMRGIALSEANCANSVNFACPIGQFVSGMNPDGTPVCVPYNFNPPPLPDLPDPPESEDVAQCGPAHGSSFATAPSGEANLCTQGQSSAVTENPGTGWSWSCTQGTATANCAASMTPVTPGVNGECGTAARADATQPPSTAAEYCAAGTQTAYTGTGPWNWSCNGVDGGTNASCTGGSAPPPPLVCAWSEPMGQTGYGSNDYAAEDMHSCGAFGPLSVFPGGGYGNLPFPHQNCVPGATCDPAGDRGVVLLGACNRGHSPLADPRVEVWADCDCVCQ